MSKRKAKSISWTFAITSGANAGLSNGPWKLNTSREDVYLWLTPRRGPLKLSLHGDDAWRIAYTREHMMTDNPLWPSNDRLAYSFTPPPFDAQGRRLALRLIMTRAAMLPGLQDPGSYTIPVDDRWDRLTAACLWMTEPDASLDSAFEMIGSPLPLESGRQVWIVRATQGTNGVPEPQCDGAMIQPLDPQEGGPDVPTLLVTGVNIA